MFTGLGVWLHKRAVAKAISRYGWTATLVREPSGRPFAYTTGFQHTLSAPEIYVAGVPPQVANGIFWTAFDEMKAGRLVLTDGLRQAGLIEGQDCIWRCVHASQIIPDNFATCLWWREHTTGRCDDVAAYQLVWPDAEHGLFPWEPGCDAETRLGQRPLWSPHDPEDPDRWLNASPSELAAFHPQTTPQTTGAGTPQ